MVVCPLLWVHICIQNMTWCIHEDEYQSQAEILLQSNFYRRYHFVSADIFISRPLLLKFCPHQKYQRGRESDSLLLPHFSYWNGISDQKVSRFISSDPSEVRIEWKLRSLLKLYTSCSLPHHLFLPDGQSSSWASASSSSALIFFPVIYTLSHSIWCHHIRWNKVCWSISFHFLWIWHSTSIESNQNERKEERYFDLPFPLSFLSFLFFKTLLQEDDDFDDHYAIPK